MRALAEAWECDPSYATWIVDRLENLGLAEQQADPNDRRVKLVALTAKGLRTRTQVLDEFHRPPPEIAALEREDLEALDRIPVEAGALSCDGTRADDTQRPACAWIAACRTAAIGASSSRTIVSRALPELTPGFSW
jgi:DNA-binding MarR family transcriptional regulator